MTHKQLEDGPLDPQFWTGEISAAIPAALRIGLGVILLGDALMALPDLYTFYGAQGVWPARLGSGLLTQLSDAGLLAFWLAGCLALFAFTVGLFTRAAALGAWFFLVSIHLRDPAITTGGDYLAQILLFFCVFLDCGAAHSLDARLRGLTRTFVAAAPLRAMQLHVAILYFVTARLKIRGGWLSGDGVYLSLQHYGFARPLGRLLLDHPELCKLSTWLVLALEGAFAFLAFSPVRGRACRLLAIACAASVQLGVLATMRVGMFTPLMLWVNVLFLPAPVRPAQQITRFARWWPVLACNAVVVLLAWGAFVGRRWPLPQLVETTARTLGLNQPFDLFGATYEVAQWHATGTLADGTELDVLATAAPGLRSEVGWRFSTFYKLTFADDADRLELARWLCAESQRERGQPLRTLHFWKHARQPVLPGETRPFADVTFYRGPCPPALTTPR